MSSLYKVDGDTLTRLKKECPKCGPGTFMGDHKDRHACGKCGYMEAKE
ncbi:MAG: 30S ribosomal protein S27ae [Thermoplasmatota archaeon]